jgi:Cu-processing system ATP-binding protein
MIEIKELYKKFGKLNVLDGLDINVEQGKVTAIVGPNGSGKTTLIKCILGLTKPDKGNITIDSHTLNGDWLYKRMIGYMPQFARFPENLTVKEIIAMIKDLRQDEHNTDEDLFNDFHLQPEANKKIRTLSGGTRQKVSAVIAFLFKPKLLILDEPTAGLDPRASSLLKDKLLREKVGGKTFIITSHIMSELEELSDNIIFLLNGKVRFQGTINNIIRDTHEQKLERAVANMMKEDVA